MRPAAVLCNVDACRADTANFAVTFGTQAAVEAFRCVDTSHGK